NKTYLAPSSWGRCFVLFPIHEWCRFHFDLHFYFRSPNRVDQEISVFQRRIKAFWSRSRAMADSGSDLSRSNLCDKSAMKQPRRKPSTSDRGKNKMAFGKLLRSGGIAGSTT